MEFVGCGLKEGRGRVRGQGNVKILLIHSFEVLSSWRKR